MTEIGNLYLQSNKNCAGCMDSLTVQINQQQAEEQNVSDANAHEGSCGCSDNDCTCTDCHTDSHDCDCGCGFGDSPDTPVFLTLITKFDSSKLEGLVYREGDVISGKVGEETDKLVSEAELIGKLTENNQNNIDILNNASEKIINFEKYVRTESPFKESVTINSSANINNRTNISNILKNSSYSSIGDKSQQEQIISGGVTILAHWLDDYINNYDQRVKEGKDRGDSELKLSFLLKLRKAIENCDFSVGFGNDEYFKANSNNSNSVIGAYSNTYLAGTYLNPTENANDNSVAVDSIYENIIFNALLFLPERKYKSEEELVAAISNNEFAYLNNAKLSPEELKAAKTKAFGDILLSSDEAYMNFAKTYYAAVLVHELTHSMHISNEVVAYNVGEAFEDDFSNKIISKNWSPDTIAAVSTVLKGVDISKITYSDGILPVSTGGGVGFHNFQTFDSTSPNSVLVKGHEENMKYTNEYDKAGNITSFGYADFKSGNTIDDDKNELMNFIV